MSSPPITKLQRIHAEVTQEMWDRLLVYAQGKTKVLTWHGVLGGEPSGGDTAHDFVQQALVRTVNGAHGSEGSDEGMRNWNPEKCSLETHLRGCIDSLVNHAASKPANKNGVRERKLVAEDAPEGASGFDGFAGNFVAPDSEEHERLREERLMTFLDHLSDDRPVQQLFELIYDGFKKRAVQAEKLNLPVTQIDALKKRLDTRVTKFAKQNEQPLK